MLLNLPIVQTRQPDHRHMVAGALSECLQVYLPFPFETAVFLQVMSKWLGKKRVLLLLHY